MWFVGRGTLLTRCTLDGRDARMSDLFDSKYRPRFEYCYKIGLTASGSKSIFQNLDLTFNCFEHLRSPS